MTRAETSTKNRRSKFATAVDDALRLGTVATIAASTGIPLTTLRGAIARREIPFIAINRRTFLLRLRDVDAWVRAREVPALPDAPRDGAA